MTIFSQDISPLIYRPWKTIQLGTGLRTSSDFTSALTQNNFGMQTACPKIFASSKFQVADLPTEVDLVALAPLQLGFRTKPRLSDFFKQAENLGFRKCIGEVGPQLRLQHTHQLYNEELNIGMDLIPSEDGNEHAFIVNHSRFSSPALDLWTRRITKGPGRLVLIDKLWVFVVPRK